MDLVSLSVTDYLDDRLADIVSLPTYHMYACSICSTVALINFSNRCLSAVLWQAIYLLPDQICLFNRALDL